jgi:capsular polysaccharide biosynthesis protein
MADQKTTQQLSDMNYQYPIEEETSFIDILAVIVKKRGLIFLFTSIFTFLSIAYSLLATPIYKAKVSFLVPPQEIGLLSIDRNLFKQTIDSGLVGEKKKRKESENSATILNQLSTDNFLYRQYLTRVQSFNQQKKVLSKKNILENFFGQTTDPKKLNEMFINLHDAISLKTDLMPFTGIAAMKNHPLYQLEKPIDLEMTGSNPIAMAEFLNTLAESTKTVIIKETQDSLQTLIDNRIAIANRTKEHLLFKAKLKAAEDYRDLSDFLKIAQSLNIKNNNFHLLKNTTTLGKLQNNTKELTKPFKNGLIPPWFLYGEKALKEEIKILNSRINQVISASRETSQSLDKRNNNFNLFNGNDDNYIKGVVDLEALIKQLKSFNVKTLIPIVALIDQPSIPPTKPINLKTEKNISIGIGLGLLLGIIAAFLSHSMEILRNRKTAD